MKFVAKLLEDKYLAFVILLIVILASEDIDIHILSVGTMLGVISILFSYGSRDIFQKIAKFGANERLDFNTICLRSNNELEVICEVLDMYPTIQDIKKFHTVAKSKFSYVKRLACDVIIGNTSNRQLTMNNPSPIYIRASANSPFLPAILQLVIDEYLFEDHGGISYDHYVAEQYNEEKKNNNSIRTFLIKDKLENLISSIHYYDIGNQYPVILLG